MLWIALAAAAQLSAPLPKNLRKWFYADDTPYYLIEKRDGVWLVNVRIGVRPDGTIDGCRVEASSGIAQLDTLTCRKILRRAKFVPATAADGSPAFGVYRRSISWIVASVPRDTSNARRPDVEVQLQSLPPDVKSPTLVRVMFAVDQSGNMGSCLAEPTKSFEHVDNVPALVPIACDRIAKSYKPIPAKDAGGNAIPSIQDALVRFTEAGAEAAKVPR
jgi:TonB family protein